MGADLSIQLGIGWRPKFPRIPFLGRRREKEGGGDYPQSEFPIKGKRSESSTIIACSVDWQQQSATPWRYVSLMLALRLGPR